MTRQTIAAFMALGVCSMAVAGSMETFARVVSVSPQVEQYNSPRRECFTEYVTASAPRSNTGAIIGGIAGGLLGSNVGGGNGRNVATAAGAVVGAITGDRLDNNMAPPITQQPVQTCRNVDYWQSRTTGYNVTYEYQGRTYSTVLPYDPGSTLRVQVSVTPARY